MANIVPERAEKGNNTLKIALLALLIVLVGVAAFGLGRLSVSERGEGSLIIHDPAAAAR